MQVVLSSATGVEYSPNKSDLDQQRDKEEEKDSSAAASPDRQQVDFNLSAEEIEKHRQSQLVVDSPNKDEVVEE